MKLLFYFDGDDDHKIDYMDIYKPCTGRDTWYTKEVATMKETAHRPHWK